MKKTIKTNSEFSEGRKCKRFYTFKNLLNANAIKSFRFLKDVHWNKKYKEKHTSKYPSDVLDHRILMANILNDCIKKNLLDKAGKNRFKCSSDETKGSSKKYSELVL